MYQMDLFSDMPAPEKKRVAKPVKKNMAKEMPLAVPIKVYKKRGRKSYKDTFTDADMLAIPTDEELFSKQYYSITQVAKWFDVNPSVLRLWEKNFSVLKVKKNGKGDRFFRPEDVKNLRIIYFLLRQQKFSIEGAKQYLKENHTKASNDLLIVESLTKMKSFLLELRANLGA